MLAENQKGHHPLLDDGPSKSDLGCIIR